MKTTILIFCLTIGLFTACSSDDNNIEDKSSDSVENSDNPSDFTLKIKEKKTNEYIFEFGKSTDPKGETITYDVLFNDISDSDDLENEQDRYGISATAFVNGTNTFTVIAKNASGLTTKKEITFQYTKPVGTLQLKYDNQFNNQHRFKWKRTLSGSNVYDVFLNDVRLTSKGTTTNFVFHLITFSKFKKGVNTLKVIAKKQRVSGLGGGDGPSVAPIEEEIRFIPTETGLK